MLEKSDILFFCRGRGKGHAVPDLSVVNELRRRKPGIMVRFASYGTGARTLSEAGETVFDMRLPEENSFLDAAVCAGTLIRQRAPSLVVSHEEFAAVPIAKMLGVPVVFMTHWFVNPDFLNMEAIQYADEVLFIDRPGVFTEPSYINGKVRYIGPILRVFRYRPDDRERARTELEIEPDEKVTLMLPGAWFTEERAPVADLVIAAFHLIGQPKARLIWVAGQDYELLSSLTIGDNDVKVIRNAPVIEQLMVACDVAVTKGTHNTGNELSTLGIRSISLSHGSNLPDDEFSQSIPTNTFLWAQDTNAPALAGHILTALRAGRAQPDYSAMNGEGAAKAATCLLETLAKI